MVGNTIPKFNCVTYISRDLGYVNSMIALGSGIIKSNIKVTFVTLVRY